MQGLGPKPVEAVILLGKVGTMLTQQRRILFKITLNPKP